jgi:dipeptidyl aminopeptidase/acylaminoacyl peptidase
MESGQGRMGVPPWADPARYARNSPLLQADAITTPLLLAHGDQDGAVPLTQSEAMFSALYRQNKDALLVTYWGEGHYISSPGNVRDLYARVREFLDAHLALPTTAAEGPAESPAPGPASSAPTPPPGRR